MNPLESLRLALEQIRSHKLKAFFALLGIAIGTTFLIAVITLVEGTNRYVREDFAGSFFGVNTFTVVRRPQFTAGPVSEAERRRQTRNPHLTRRDVEVVLGAVADSARVAWGYDRSASEIRHADRSRRNIRVVAGSEGYAQIQGWDVETGRGLTPLDHRRSLRGIVLGASISERLFPDRDPLGQRVRIAGHRFRVVGVFERKGGLTGNLLDAAVYLPFSTFRETLSPHPGRVEEIHVKAPTRAAMESLMPVVEGALRADRELRPGEESDFHLQTSTELLRAWRQINRILLTALPGLVSISLVVGGIVIMNIMLVSVAQRTREIGIRKALGARRRDITLQFLAESAGLALLGAAAGVVLGVAIARGVEALTPLPVSVPLWAVAAAVALGVGVGVASGLYPARRAARLDPIDALRYE